MRRREFGAVVALALGASRFGASAAAEVWRSIEKRSRGRLGVAVLDTATGDVDGLRLDEPFRMCSTFKWLLAAAVLRRVDEGAEHLERRVAYGPRALLAYSPTTSKHAHGDGLTVGELCEAAVTLSDNAAANLLLASVGGPAAVTRQARALGDDRTRLDRIEPALNDAPPDDPRDTTTPRAMAGALRTAALGDGLSARSRDQLVAWLAAARTGLDRLRADLPPGWRAGDKTGTWSDAHHGTSNDVAVFWPPGRPPLVVAAYLTDCTATSGQRDATLAEVGRAVFARA